MLKSVWALPVPVDLAPLALGAGFPLAPAADFPLALGAGFPLAPAADFPLALGAGFPLAPAADFPPVLAVAALRAPARIPTSGIVQIPPASKVREKLGSICVRVAAVPSKHVCARVEGAMDANERQRLVGSVAEAHSNVSAKTVDEYLQRHPSLKDVLAAARETAIDHVESKLMGAIDDGNVTAIIFFLKTRGKSRGYTERSEHDLTSAGEPFKFTIKINGRDDETTRQRP
jgi:hypothetical protein